MTGRLGGRLARLEEAANPPGGPHVIFIPYDMVEMKGEAYERWRAAAVSEAPPAARIIFVRWRMPGEAAGADEGGANAGSLQ